MVNGTTPSDTIELPKIEGATPSDTIELSKVELPKVDGQGLGVKDDQPEFGHPPPEKVLHTAHEQPNPNPENLQPEKEPSDSKPYEIGHSKPPKQWSFQKGNPGRPKGSRAKLGEDFLLAMQEDFHTHGVGVIEKVRLNSPTAYLKIIANLLPKDINLKLSSTEEMTDDQLLGRIRLLSEAIQPLLVASRADESSEGGGTPTEDKKADVLYTVSKTDDVP